MYVAMFENTLKIIGFRFSNGLRFTSLSRVLHVTSLAPVSHRKSNIRRDKFTFTAMYGTVASSNYGGNFYPATCIQASLPRDVTDCDGQVLSVNYATVTEVTTTLRAMLKSSSERGDNIGTDEFEGPHRNYLMDYSFVFTAKWRHRRTSSIAAFIVIGPSTFSRTIDPSLADIHVIRASDISDSMYFELIETSIELTRELDVGYMDCIMSVSVSCESILSVLTDRLKFTVAATIPVSVHMANGIGLVDNKVLLRNIATPGQRRRSRSREEVLLLLSKHGIVDGVDDDNQYNATTLPSVPFLPQQYFFKRADLLVTIRNLRKDQDREAFQLLDNMARQGVGIPLFDIPTLAFFRRLILPHGECIVFEDSKNGRMIGWSYTGLSWLSRSPSSKAVESTIVLAKEYQNLGIGREIFQLVTAMAKQLGYKSLLNDYFASNVRSAQSAKQVSSIIGLLPRSAYFNGTGWQDQVLAYNDLTGPMPTFSHLVNENRKICDVAKRREPGDQSKL